MRSSSLFLLPVFVSLGCSSGTVGSSEGSGGSMPVTSMPDAGSTAGMNQHEDAAPPNTGTGTAEPDGSPPNTGTGPTRDAATPRDSGTSSQRDAGSGPVTTPDSGAVGHAGNPNGSCSTGVPARGQPVDTTTPTTVVGTGTAASCTFAALRTAITAGGVITFNCGTSPVTIPVTATLNLPTTKNTVIDGGNKITLDGGSAVQILSFDSANFQANNSILTLQHLTVINGKKTGTQAIPAAPAPCSQGWDDGQGGALYMRDGNLVIIDSIFMNNQAALLGPDTGGGAIYVLGSKNGVLIVGSTFTNNTAANGAAVGTLFAELDVYNSLFTGNVASGNGANYDDATQCSVMNNDQNEVGSGGNGGALYNDGASVNITLCGDAILNNKAGAQAFGGGLFFTSNDMNGTLSITDTTMTGNTGGSWTNVSTGSVTNVGTAVGVNARSIAVVNSTLQGRP
jgi:hypothetical protein